MDFQSTQMVKEKRHSFSKAVVVLCLTLTAILLISSLVSPSKAQIPRSNTALPLSQAG